MEFDYTGLVNQNEFYLGHYRHVHVPEKIRGVRGLRSRGMRRRTCWTVWSTRWRSPRIIQFHAPFDKCDREEDYREAWAFFERARANGQL